MQQLVDCNQGTVYIRECDADLIAQFVGCCQIQTTSDITIGGFVFMSEDGRKEYNVTLDQALIDQVSWFEEKSQLVL